MMNEEITLNRCVERLKKLIPAKEVNILRRETLSYDTRVDGILEVVLDRGKIEFAYEVKNIMKRPIHTSLYDNINTIDNFILFAEYVNSLIAEDLKKNKVNYVDSQGNAFLNIPNQIYVDVQGNTLKISKEKQATAIFQPKGLQLLSLVLTNKNAINYSLRDLAQMSSISLGRTVTIIKELKDAGFIIKSSNNKNKINKRKRLFDKWVENYGERLRPKLITGPYKISAKMNIQIISHTLNENSIDFAFGGETGAQILTQYYNADCIDLFVPKEKTMDVVKYLKLAPAEEYNVHLFNLYSDRLIFQDDAVSAPVVLPIMLYAELLFQGSDRAVETAEILFDKYIKKMFK